MAEQDRDYDEMDLSDFLKTYLMKDWTSDELFREELAKRLNPILADIPEFKTLDEIVNADHKDRLHALEEAVRLDDDWHSTDPSEWSFWNFIFYRGQLTDKHWTALRAIFTDTMSLASAAVVEDLATRLGTLEAGHLHDKESTHEQFEHLHIDTFSIDQIKDEIMELYASKISTLEKKLETILEHIGDQPVTKTLKEELAAIKEG